MPPRIAALAERYMRNPVRVTVAGKEMTVPQIRQVSYEVPRARKVDALGRILDAETPSLAMIFARTKVGVDELGEALLARGYAVETLHGDLSQAQRDRVMRRFRGGQAEILIATDVAARGLDIPAVSHVYNFDVPHHADDYVHRIGRTGRAGRSGTAITIVAPADAKQVAAIEKLTGQTIAWAAEPATSPDAPQQSHAHDRGGERPRGDRQRQRSRRGERGEQRQGSGDQRQNSNQVPTAGAKVTRLDESRSRRQPSRPLLDEGDDTHLPAFLLRPVPLKA
jgi:ATP-dependent RNA helicase DeaD